MNKEVTQLTACHAEEEKKYKARQQENTNREVDAFFWHTPTCCMSVPYILSYQSKKLQIYDLNHTPKVCGGVLYAN